MPWKSGELSVDQLYLDFNNPRIDATSSSTQEDLRLLLLKYEKVADLAQSICQSHGLLAGERVIVIVEKGKTVVLEGNRRVCACQLLVNRDLIPDTFKKHFYFYVDPAVVENVKSIQVDFAPSRKDAEVIITRRHTEPGVEGWTPIAKQRRIARLIAAGKTLDAVADEFGIFVFGRTACVRVAHVIVS